MRAASWTCLPLANPLEANLVCRSSTICFLDYFISPALVLIANSIITSAIWQIICCCTCHPWLLGFHSIQETRDGCCACQSAGLGGTEPGTRGDGRRSPGVFIGNNFQQSPRNQRFIFRPSSRASPAYIVFSIGSRSRSPVIYLPHFR